MGTIFGNVFPKKLAGGYTLGRRYYDIVGGCNGSLITMIKKLFNGFYFKILIGLLKKWLNYKFAPGYMKALP